MNGVKGLLLKEFYLRRRTLPAALAILLLFMILAASVCLSLDYGNLAGNESFTHKDTVFLAYAAAAIAMLISGVDCRTFAQDIKCRWNIFEYTLPLSPKKLAAVRIGLVSGASIAGLGVSVLCSWIIYALAHQRYTLDVFKNISVIALILFIITVTANVLNLKYKDPQKAANRFAAGIFLLYALAAAVFLYSSEFGEQFSGLSEEEFNEVFKEKFLVPAAAVRDALFPYFILIFAAIAAIGYWLILRYTKRREK